SIPGALHLGSRSTMACVPRLNTTRRRISAIRLLLMLSEIPSSQSAAKVTTLQRFRTAVGNGDHASALHGIRMAREKQWCADMVAFTMQLRLSCLWHLPSITFALLLETLACNCHFQSA